MAGVSMYQLMENAGEAVFQCIREHYPQVRNILVLAGHGNNGGDAYVVARLCQEQGLQCHVCELGNSDKASEDAKTARAKWQAFRPDIIPLQRIDFQQYQLCIDGLLGTGINGAVRPPFADLINQVNQSGINVVSIDVPSGMNADTGQICGTAIQAQHTVTFVGQKSGLVTGVGKQLSGQRHFSCLGIAEAFQRLAQPVAKLMDFREMPVLPQREVAAHKGTFGKLLCIGGNEGFGGAIRLTSEAALRTGAGLVKVYCHDSARLTVSASRPELMVETRTSQLSEQLKWSSAVVIGPGLGKDIWAQQTLQTVLEHCLKYHKHIVVDADALNLVAENPTMSVPANLSILTPHAAEAGRLLNMTAAQVETNRYQAATLLTQKFDAVALLKGAGSLVAAQDNTWVCQNGNPGMATAGMGDVLCGVLGALMAQGMSNRLSALYGVCLHSYAADLAAQENGEIGLLASDLFPYIRTLINRGPRLLS